MQRALTLRRPRPHLLPACIILLCLASATRADWVWQKDVGWVNMGGASSADASERFARACALMTEGSYAPALEQLQRLRQELPPAPLPARIKLRMVECLCHLGRAEEGIELAANLLADRPDGISMAEAWRLRYECARTVAEGQPSTATALLLDDASAEDADNLSAPAALWQAAHAYSRVGYHATAIARLEQLRARYPNDPNAVPALRKMGECGTLLGIEQNARGELPEDAAQAYAKYLELRADSTDAETIGAMIPLLHSASLEQEPGRRQVYYAVCQYYMGETRKAEEALAQSSATQKGNPAGEMASYYRILALMRLGDRRGALDACERFLREYPASAKLEDALMAEHQLGTLLLSAGDENGLKVMDSLFAHSPLGPLADDALLEKGKYLLAKREFIESKRLFEEVLERYPARETAAEALFRLGQARLGQRDYHPERDSIAPKARESFELYLRQYPNGPFAEQARQLVKQCREMEAARLWSIAEFYMNRSRPDAAAVYLKIILADYPDTDIAGNARTWLKQGGTNQ